MDQRDDPRRLVHTRCHEHARSGQSGTAPQPQRMIIVKVSAEHRHTESEGQDGQEEYELALLPPYRP